MASKLLSERAKTILYWAAIIILFALFIGFLVAYIKKEDASNDVSPSEPPPTTTPLPSEEEIRLDANVIPYHYQLEVTSDQDNDQFSGKVSIDFTAKESTRQVKMHCKNLEVSNYRLTDATGAEVTIADVDQNSILELCTFGLTKDIKGNYTISTEYSGKFREGQITGFYKSSYLDNQGNRKYLTASKFEPTYARSAFPAFDEPALKATWDISVVHQSSLTALSNEDVIKTEEIAGKDGWSRTTFKQTVPMSTYLVCFIVSDFKYTETRTTNGLRVRVYSRPDEVEKTKIATEVAAGVIRYYENYTDIPYALSKLDLIGLPEFVSGALETYGLITFKETYILYSETDSSLADLKQITSVISHELSHMFYGNYISPSWWNFLFLNEGFASYFEYKGQNSIQNAVSKRWNVFDFFITSDLQPAMRADSLKSARPIVSPVLTPDQITSIFDTFSYGKAASVLYVVENIIGKDAFQKCSRNYLKSHPFGVVDTDDMINAYKDEIKKATGIEGDLFLKKYLFTNSYAIVSVERVGKDSLKLTQSAYNANSTTVLEEPWNMQVDYLLTENRKGAFYLSKVSQTVKLNNEIAENEWFKLNTESTGYYIVSYSENDWKLLIDQLKLKPTIFSVKDRANIIFDAGQLSDKELVNYETLFSLFDYLKNENDYLPWSVASSLISSIQSKLISTSSFSIVQYNSYIRDLVSNLYDQKVDLTADLSTMTYEQIALRNVLISLACRVESEKCISQASSLFRSWLDNGVKVDANIRSHVYKYGLKASNDDTDWKRVWDLYVAERDALEKSKLMSALSSTSSTTMLLTLISYSRNQSMINNENFFSVQQNIAASSDLARGMVWDYIKNNWDELVERFGLNDRRLGNYVKSVTSGFGTAARLQEMEDFFSREPDAGAGASARQSALEAVKKNIQWAADSGEKISASLNLRDKIEKPWLNWRLDEFISPTQYDLSFDIDVDQEKFSGTVTIQMEVRKPIRYLILHAKDLTISTSKVYTQKEKTLVSQDGSFEYKDNQFWVIPMKQIISSGSYTAELSFNGPISSSLNGLYISRYNSTNGEQRKLATTQMEAGFARRVFPSFDEPHFKATFTISITHASKYNAISNMPVDYTRSNSDDKITTVFKKSSKISTYLIAMVVSDFVSKKSPLSSDFSVYTYNPEMNLPKVDLALNYGPRLLDYFESYFQVSIAQLAPKMDLISIPDFSMGAMENVGLVTFRDVYILYDETESTSSSKMQVCSIIAHELAHMWYGNLVTLDFWNELWLNEGFAQFMMYKATAVVEPTWSYNEHFAIKELSRVFDIDTSLSTHPILTPVRDENDMQSIFDPVTYAKGASIIRMLENTIGEENFRKAVSNYMKKYSYSNTVSTQLWAEFSDVVAASKLDVGSMMDTWISKEGIPVVTVSINSDGTFIFKQERFLKDFDYSNSSYAWYIPLTYRVFDPKNPDLDNPVGKITFNQLTANASIAEFSTDNAIKFNVDQTGVYILNYPNKNWNQFIDILSDNTSLARQKLSVLDRNNLLSDAFYLSRSGRLSYDITLKLAAAMLSYEDSYIVWVTASDMLRFLRTFAITEDQGIAFNHWLLSIGVSRLYDQLGWEPAADEDLNQRQLRALILDLACLADHELCLQTANQKFAEFQQQVSGRTKRSIAFTPDPDTFNVFLYHTMRTVKTESDTKYAFLMAQYKSALSTNEKMRYLRALAAVSEPNLLDQLVKQSLDTDFLRPQDYFTFLAYIASNPVGLDIAWKSYRDNFQTIQDRFGLDDSNLGRAVYRFASYFTSSARQTEVQQFFSKYSKAGASELYRQQTIELISANLQWSSKFYSPVIEHITNKCDSKTCPWNVFRLNQKVVPDLYEITIQVNTDSFLYNGSVKTHISVADSVNYIILHCASILTPSKPSVYAAGENGVKRDNTDLSTSTGFRYSPLEFYVIPLKQALTNGKYIVEVSFEGNLLLGGQVGLYRGFYEDNSSGTAKTVNLAATQFESTHARKMFPCFDEPHFKQYIDMTIIHEENKNATLSNMKVAESEPYLPIPGWVKTSYERSVKMVTYLIAILVSDFQCTSTTVSGSGSGSELIVSTCASKVHHLKKHEYSLEVTPNIIKHYENFTNFKYQLDKLDQIAIPQFSAGAMENWGLVKYREKMLLWTEAEETSAEQRSVVAVIAHELAHMWFGNTVTCDFWGSLWLNEAFASYFEYSAVASVHPEWNYFDTLAYYDQFNAMLSDSSESSQPIVRDVSSPALMGYSSAIVYNKGSSILNMFNNTIGPEKFQLSLQAYLKENQYTSVTTSYLFDQFAKNWGYPEQNITDFMRSWTYQPGFPYLNITLNDDKTYTVTQERFLQNGARPKKDYLYVIPFSYYTLEAKTKKLQTSAMQFLIEKTTKISSQFSSSIKINPGFNNFYLVNYPESYWTELTERLLANKDDFINSLMVNDRAELLISSFLLSRAKLTNYLVPFRLYNYLVNEKHFVPWYYYDYTLSYLALRMDRTEYRESLMQFERRLTTPHYTGIDFWDDSVGHNLEKSFRMLLITITCRSGNKQCLEDAYKKFSDWKNANADINYLPPNLRGNILCYGIRASKSKSDYSFVWEQYTKTKSDSPLKTIYIRALSFITDQDTLKNYIDLALDESVVPVGDFTTFFNYIIENYAHETMAWNYFKENYSMLARKLTSSQIDSILSRFATYSVTSERKLEISTFLSAAPKLGSESGRRSALQTVDSNLAWMTTRKTLVGEWFTKNACGKTTPEPCPWSRLQIDKTEVKPTQYDLNIQVNLTTYIYNGTINVEIETLQNLNFLTLNAASILSVELVEIVGPNKEQVDGEMFRYKPQDYVVIRFSKALLPGKYLLTFNFRGSMLEAGLSGLYLSNYSSSDATSSSTGTIGVTQFEFYDARKVMVSFDQPGFKTPFSVAITHDKKMNTTLSNMDISSSAPVPGMPDWVITKYKESPPMPTYLVAMLISDFVCVQDTVSNIRYGVCAAPPQQSKMGYALSIASKTMQGLEKQTGVKIQLEKIDLLAIPDFLYGAMENTGLVTFRETALLFSESETTSASKMGIASIVAHELAHFFFGNLVTCDWWDVLFLNEAFATFMQNYAVDQVEPTWKVHEMFLMDDYESAVRTDSVDTVHPILRPITTTKQIDQFTSSIVYSKGSTVLRQTAFVMRVDNFFKSINKYLVDNADGNVRETDLFKQLDVNFPKIDGVHSATEYLQEWIKEKGFPYVNVSREDSGYKVVQKRFLLSPEGSTSTIWKVPLSFYTNTSWTDYKLKFLTKSEDIITGAPQSGLVKFNSGHNGLFLVNYSPDLWNDWINAMVNNFTTTNLPVVDRAGLLLDSFYLAKANLLNYAIPLKLARYLVNEEHITPWTIAIRGINGIRNNVVFGSLYSAEFQQYIRDIVSPFYEKLGWDDADGNEVKRRLRATILDFACANNHNDCLNQSKSLFKQWKEGKSSGNQANVVKPNLLSIVLKYGIQDDASTENWQFLWSEYLKETSASLRSTYLSALANTQNQESIKMLLNQALDTTAIRSQDVNLVLSAVANSKNTQSIETLWQFYKTNYKQLAGPTSPLRQVQLSSLLNSICANYFFTADRKSELESFFSQNPTLGLTGSQRTSAINTINSNMAWIQNRMIEVENFLQCGEELCPFTGFRLSPLVYPETYDLFLDVDLEKDQFSGTVKITTNIKAQNLRYINVHAASTLSITSSRVVDSATKSELAVKRAFFYKPYSFWVVELEKSVRPGIVELYFEFHSKLATDMSGFYLSEYYDPSTQKMVKLAATQFQATSARRCFPSFDEPSFKSVFNVKLKHKKEYTSTMSNNKILSQEANSDGTVTTTFDKSPKMVTYLLAFIVSDFHCDKTTSSNGTTVQVCSSPPMKDMIPYALEISPQLLETFGTKFSFSYNQMLPKMDIVAIPDFSAGAMENWGLVTFRETALLWKETISSAYDKMRVASVVAHELAHMWTGNLVTCLFWSDLWINESFASFLEWFSVDILQPKWAYTQLFFVTDSIPALNADASLTTHPLVRTVNSPGDIPYISAITYQKGSSILRMFEFVFKTDPFFNTITNYLNENQYTSVPSSVILNAFSAIPVDKLNSTQFVYDWTTQAGFPYINLTYATDGKANSYVVTQERFLASGRITNNSQKWTIPLSYYKNYLVDSSFNVEYITEKTQNVAVEVTSSDVPVKFNVDSQGFYIVLYPLEDWNKWIQLFQNVQATKETKLTSQDYSHLLYDSSVLAGAGHLPYTVPLELTALLRHKADFSIFNTGSSIFSQLWPIFRTNETTGIGALMQSTFRAYVQNLVSNLYSKYGLQSAEPESFQEQRLRSEVSSFACAYGLDRCLLEAQVEFKKWQVLDSSISPNVRPTVLRYAIQESTKKSDWENLWNAYVKTWQTSVKLDYLQALAQTSDKELLNLLFERANDQSLVRRQDYLSLYSYAVRTQTGYEVAWSYFTANYRTIRANRLSDSQIGTVAGYFARYLKTKQQKDEFQQFFIEHTDTGISTTNLNKALETIDKNVAWVNTYRKVVYDWFRTKNSQTMM